MALDEPAPRILGSLTSDKAVSVNVPAVRLEVALLAQTMVKPRVLIVAHAFPPVAGSHTTRVVHWIKYLVRLGWEVAVLTPEAFGNAPLMDAALGSRVPAEVRVYRTPSGRIHSLFYAITAGRGSNSGRATGRSTWSWVRRGLSATAQLARRLMVPDTIVEWFPFGVHYGRKAIKDFRPDVLLSSAVPYTAHLIATNLAKRFGLPLVADYGDPWVFDPGHPRRGIRYFIEYPMEEAVLRRASFVTVTTEETRQNYLSNYRLAADKVRVLSMGYDPDDFQDAIQHDPTKFNVVYAGRLEAVSRNPDVFVDAIRSLRTLCPAVVERLSIKFIGHYDTSFTDRVKSAGLGDVIQVEKWLPHDVCMKILAGADTLLLFGNAGVLQVPGKVFNYLGAERPILMILNGNSAEVDPAAKLIRNAAYPPVIVNNDASEIQFAIRRLFDAWSLGTLQTKIAKSSPAVSTEYSWLALTQQLSATLLASIELNKERHTQHA